MLEPYKYPASLELRCNYYHQNVTVLILSLDGYEHVAFNHEVELAKRIQVLLSGEWHCCKSLLCTHAVLILGRCW